MGSLYRLLNPAAIGARGKRLKAPETYTCRIIFTHSPLIILSLPEQIAMPVARDSRMPTIAAIGIRVGWPKAPETYACRIIVHMPCSCPQESLFAHWPGIVSGFYLKQNPGYP